MSGADRTARQDCFYFTPASEASLDDGCLALTIETVKGRRSVQVELIRRGGDWMAGYAAGPEAPICLPVDIETLQLTDRRLEGIVAVRTARMGYGEVAYTITAERFRIEAWVKRSGVEGTAQRVRPGTTDTDEDRETMACTGRFLPFGQPQFPPARVIPLNLDPLADQKGLESQATVVYEQIRAMALMKNTGLPFEIAIREIPPYRPQRPVLSAGKAGRPAPNKKGPSLDDVGLGISTFSRPSRTRGARPGSVARADHCHAGPRSGDDPSRQSVPHGRRAGSRDRRGKRLGRPGVRSVLSPLSAARSRQERELPRRHRAGDRSAEVAVHPPLAGHGSGAAVADVGRPDTAAAGYRTGVRRRLRRGRTRLASRVHVGKRPSLPREETVAMADRGSGVR